jgi:hypothetical protein
MKDKDKIPTVPCKECLIKPLCKSKIGPGTFSVIGLDCSILDKWLSTRYTIKDRLIMSKFEIVHTELCKTRVSKKEV